LPILGRLDRGGFGSLSKGRPAFAEAASRRQAPGEREIIRVFSTELRLKNGMEFVMNKNPVSFLVNAEEGNDDSFF
jgi:hypothetical protein